MLVENAPSNRLVGHAENVRCDAEHHRSGYPSRRGRPDTPADRLGNAATAGAVRLRLRQEREVDQDQIRDRNHKRNDGQRNEQRPDPLDVCDQSDGKQACGNGKQQALALADQIGFLLLELSQLARVVDVVANPLTLSPRRFKSIPLPWTAHRGPSI